MSLNYITLGVTRTIQCDLTERLDNVSIIEEFAAPTYKVATYTVRIKVLALAGNLMEWNAGPFNSMDEALALFGPHHFDAPYTRYVTGGITTKITHSVAFDPMLAMDSEHSNSLAG